MDILKLSDFKKLNNLKPTVYSTFLKLEEEKGEVAEILGKFKRINGEKINSFSDDEIYNKLFEEFMDIAQVCITMIYVLCEDTEIYSNILFSKLDSNYSLSYYLKKMSVLQGNIASILLEDSSNSIDYIDKLTLINLFINICHLSCNCIYILSDEAKVSLDAIYTTHLKKLSSRGYI